jgi:predicted Rossmann-fold nucleotide-binding protein
MTYYTASMPLRRVCVLCGSSTEAPAEYAEVAARVGRLLAENSIAVVHGGAAPGLLAALADAALAAGGMVMDAPPEEWPDLCDGFLALPGGVDTLEELFRVWGTDSPRERQKPCGLLNTADYYTALLRAVDDAGVERFVRETQRGMLIVDRDPAALLLAMAEFRPPETRRYQPPDW